MSSESTSSPARIRFDDFEVDLESHELWRLGHKVRLQEKSFLVLETLLARPGRVVSREELAAALWPSEHFVDAEHGLNTAVRRLREALGDAADQPRYVETLPRLGYRFRAGIEPSEDPVHQRSPEGESDDGEAPSIPGLHRAGFLATTVLLALAAAIVGARLMRTVPPRNDRPVAEVLGEGDSKLVDELLARARYLRNHKRFADARGFVEEALRLDPGNAEALSGLALAQLAEGEYEQSRETAIRAIELDPQAWESHRVLGNLAAWSGDYATAEHHYRRAVEANPIDSKSRNRLARHLLECGRLDEAKEQMVESRRLAPDDPDVQNIWIQYALLVGDYEDAIRQGEIWMAVWGGQIPPQIVSGVHYLLGLAYTGARRPQDAIDQFHAIDPNADLLTAIALAHAGRIPEARAIVAANEATIANEGRLPDPVTSESLGLAYAMLGDLDQVFEQLDRQLAEASYPAWVHLPLVDSIRRDERWPALAARVEQEFFAGRDVGRLPSPRRDGRFSWPMRVGFRSAAPGPATEATVP